jgi:hypothetical protein
MSEIPAPSTNGSTNGQAALPSEAVSDGRGRNGRFLARNKFSMGNPFARKVASMRTASLEELTPSDVRSLVRKLFELAMNGDTTAGAIVLRYTVGPPLPSVDPDGLDQDLWDRVRRYPSRAEFELTGVQTCLPGPAAELIQLLREHKPNLCDAEGRANGRDLLAEKEESRRRRRNR